MESSLESSLPHLWKALLLMVGMTLALRLRLMRDPASVLRAAEGTSFRALSDRSSSTRFESPARARGSTLVRPTPEADTRCKLVRPNLDEGRKGKCAIKLFKLLN